MKKLLLTGLLLTASMLSFAQTITGTNKTSKEVEKLVKKGQAVLIDVRTPEEFREGHLKYAKNVDYKNAAFTSEITKLPADKPIYLYCRSGNRSGKGADTLLHHGFTNVANIGGFEDLKKAGLPAE